MYNNVYYSLNYQFLTKFTKLIDLFELTSIFTFSSLFAPMELPKIKLQN